MNKESTKFAGIKDSIANLFILKDSCQGTCMTQKDNPNIIWFEGATMLLQQSVDNLNSANKKIDSGDKDATKIFSQKVKETLSKLMVLQRSAIITKAEDVEENVLWFEGADYMISDVINELQGALRHKGINEEEDSETEDSEPEDEAEEEEDIDPDDDVPQKSQKDVKGVGNKQ